MLVTCEPGLYFGAAALTAAISSPVVGPFLVADAVMAYVNASFGGVRIEVRSLRCVATVMLLQNLFVTQDIVLITSSGNELLSAAAPREAADIETLMRGSR
jgi:hypothetical protein